LEETDPMAKHRTIAAALALLSVAWVAHPALAEKTYDPGASDTEIKLGQTMPYSGPLSAFATLARA
jgi:branched-chain amino acid transport system substrate-binding protein